MNIQCSLIRKTVCIPAIMLLGLGLSGCGLLHPHDYPTSGPTKTATSNPQEVKADDFGHSWNLTVDHGTISCEENSKGDPILRFTSPDGTVYALNSLDENSDLPSIEKIANGSVGTLRTFAFSVCDAKHK